MKVTLAEAKKRFRTHTINVLSESSRLLLKKGIEWKMVNDKPICILGNDLIIGFERDKRGNVGGVWLAKEDLIQLI